MLFLRVGPSRQHAPLEVNRLIWLPHPGHPQAPVEVRLFDHLASHSLQVQADSSREVRIPIPDRVDAAGSQVCLRVRQHAGHARRLAAEAMSSSGTLLSPGAKRRGREEGFDRSLEWIQDLVQQVLREQPDDPCRFMLQQCRQRLAASTSSSSSSGSGGIASPFSGIGRISSGAGGDGSRVLQNGATACAASASAVAIRADISPSLAAKPRPPSKPCPGRTGMAGFRRQVAAAGPALADAAPVGDSDAESEESLRDRARAAVSGKMAALVIGRVRQRLLGESRAGGVSRCASRSGRRRSTHTRVSLSEACDLVSASAGDALPTPIVSLGAERNSWGQWLSLGHS